MKDGEEIKQVDFGAKVSDIDCKFDEFQLKMICTCIVTLRLS